MQDLTQDNYMVYDRAWDRVTVSHKARDRVTQLPRVSSLDNERDLRKLELSLNNGVTGSQVISTQSIRSARKNLRGYRHNGMVVLTMNNAIVDGLERLTN